MYITYIIECHTHCVAELWTSVLRTGVFELITLVADLYFDLIAALLLIPLKKGNFEMKKTTYAIAMAAAITAASLSIPAFAATEAELSTANAEIMALVNAGMSFEDAVAAAIAANPAMAAAIVEAAVTARPELIETILVKAIAAYKVAVGGSGSPAFGEGLKKIVASAVAVVGADSPEIAKVSTALKTSGIAPRVVANTLISAGVSETTVKSTTGSTGGTAPAGSGGSTTPTASPSV